MNEAGPSRPVAGVDEGQLRKHRFAMTTVISSKHRRGPWMTPLGIIGLLFGLAIGHPAYAGSSSACGLLTSAEVGLAMGGVFRVHPSGSVGQVQTFEEPLCTYKSANGRVTVSVSVRFALRPEHDLTLDEIRTDMIDFGELNVTEVTDLVAPALWGVSAKDDRQQLSVPVPNNAWLRLVIRGGGDAAKSRSGAYILARKALERLPTWREAARL
jgi:hypothetical protein